MSINRIPSLDGLRAFSIILVCMGHVAGTVNAPDIFLPLQNFGNFGVKIFFVISGFLITYLLLCEREKTGTINLKEFYKRRTLRIFPAFYFYVFCIGAASLFGVIELWKGDFFHAATYTMNYHHERSWWLNHTWSLAIEEQFYLIWPLSLLLIGKLKTNIKGRHIALAVIVLVPLIRVIMWYGLGVEPSAVTREFQAVADGLATGCFLGYLYKDGVEPPKWFQSKLFYVIPVSLFVIPAIMMKFSPGLFYILGQSVIHFCSAAMIWRFVMIKRGLGFRLLNISIFVWIGGLSYSLYLWQEPFLNSWVQDWFATFPLNIILAIACALFSYYLIEKPFLRYRTKPKKDKNKKTPSKTFVFKRFGL